MHWGHTYLLFRGSEERRLIAIGALRWEETSWGPQNWVSCVLMSVVLCWGSKRRYNETAGLQLLVQLLRLPVDLRMVSGGEANGNSQEGAESLPELRPNLRPLSVSTSLWRPRRQKMWCNMTSAFALAKGNVGRGMKWTILENLSTTVRTVTSPS